MKTMTSIEALELAIAEWMLVRPTSWISGGMMGKFWFKWDSKKGWRCIYRVNGVVFGDAGNDTIFLHSILEPWIAVSPDDLSKLEEKDKPADAGEGK